MTEALLYLPMYNANTVQGHNKVAIRAKKESQYVFIYPKSSSKRSLKHFIVIYNGCYLHALLYMVTKHGNMVLQRQSWSL